MRIVRIETRQLPEGAKLGPRLIGRLSVDLRGVIVVGEESELIDVPCSEALSYYLVLPEASVQELRCVLELFG